MPITPNFEQRVEKQAYELYTQKGSVSGHEWDDWFQAEKMVEAQMSGIDKDCARSESFYEVTHRSRLMPSGIKIEGEVYE